MAGFPCRRKIRTASSTSSDCWLPPVGRSGSCVLCAAIGLMLGVAYLASTPPNLHRLDQHPARRQPDQFAEDKDAPPARIQADSMVLERGRDPEVDAAGPRRGRRRKARPRTRHSSIRRARRIAWLKARARALTGLLCRQRRSAGELADEDPRIAARRDPAAKRARRRAGRAQLRHRRVVQRQRSASSPARSRAPMPSLSVRPARRQFRRDAARHGVDAGTA